MDEQRVKEALISLLSVGSDIEYMDGELYVFINNIQKNNHMNEDKKIIEGKIGLLQIGDIIIHEGKLNVHLEVSNISNDYVYFSPQGRIDEISVQYKVPKSEGFYINDNSELKIKLGSGKFIKGNDVK